MDVQEQEGLVRRVHSDESHEVHMIFCGIDVGNQGAVGFINTSNGKATVYDMPYCGREVDVAVLDMLLRWVAPDFIFLNAVPACRHTPQCPTEGFLPEVVQQHISPDLHGRGCVGVCLKQPSSKRRYPGGHS